MIVFVGCCQACLCVAKHVETVTERWCNVAFRTGLIPSGEVVSTVSMQLIYWSVL